MRKLIYVGLVLIVAGAVAFWTFLGTPYDPENASYLTTEPPDNLVRTIEHESAGNITTFAAKAHETDGAYTLLDIELKPGGENAVHYHEAFAETFTAVSGTLGITLDGEEVLLDEGESATAPVGTSHNFFNPTDETIRFEVKIEPGHEGFERALYMLYGLDRDGKVSEDGFDNIYHTALFVMMSDTRGDGALRVMRPLFNRLAGRAQELGIEDELMERYYITHTE